MNSTRRSHLSGFDWLRAFMSVAVVLWHGHSFGTSELFRRQLELPYQLRASDLVNFNVLLVAVPTFITIACFLYGRGLDAPHALSRRLRRVGLLLCVWPILHMLFHGGYPNLARRISDLDGWEWGRFVASGGGTIYYYFFSQIVALLVASVALRMPRTVRSLLLPLGLLLLCLQLALRLQGGSWLWTAHHDPLNFIPCALAVAALPRDLEQRSIRFQVGLALGLMLVAVVLATIEWRLLVSPWFFPGNGYGFPPYTRPSITLTSLGLVVVSLALHRPAPAWVRFMSRHSLALYCLHPLLFSILARHFSSTFLVGDQWQWYACVPVILGRYGLSILLQRAVFQRGILS